MIDYLYVLRCDPKGIEPDLPHLPSGTFLLHEGHLIGQVGLEVYQNEH